MDAPYPRRKKHRACLVVNVLLGSVATQLYTVGREIVHAFRSYDYEYLTTIRRSVQAALSYVMFHKVVESWNDIHYTTADNLGMEVDNFPPREYKVDNFVICFVVNSLRYLCTKKLSK